MLWPHQAEFRYRRAIFNVGCGLSLLASFLWPGLDPSERVLVPCFIVFCAATGFFLFRWYLRTIVASPNAPTWLLPLFSFVGFYGAAAAPIWVALVAAGAIDDSRLESAVGQAFTIPGSIVMSLAGAAAVMDKTSRGLSPNNPLDR
jgi:hypothetical protein